MSAHDADNKQPIPWWIWAVMIALSIIPPLTHFWIAHFPPQGCVPTGIHGVDGAVFIACMRMFETGFFAPFANCHAPLGTHASAYFAAPFFWIYGALGTLGRVMHLDAFQWLGWANGVGGFIYLLAAYLFLREAFPKQANLAFILFALAGGPGGILYIATGILGLHHAPEFEAYFYRYALYQLFEGACPSPILAMPRLYYTLSLACCFGALTCLLKGRRVGATALLFLGTLINLRYGPMAWGVAVLFLFVDSRRGVGARVREGIVLAIPVIAAWGIGWLMLRRSPAFVTGALAEGRSHMWLSPFLSVMLFHLLVVPREVMIGTRALPRLPRICAHAALGYLAAYGMLYAAYSAYFGNLWRCLDYTSAVRISDWSLIGVPLGIAIGGLPRKVRVADGNRPALYGSVALWLLGFLAVSISAFGQGWFLRFAPERAMVFLALPFAISAALGIQRLRETRPAGAKAIVALLLTGGISGIAVASACFQGPLGHRPGRPPYAYAHCELMTDADAELLKHIAGGVVMTPVSYGPSFGDVVTQRRDTSAVFGFGSLNLSDRDHQVSKVAAMTFYEPRTPDALRKQIVADWCVQYVLCPDNPSVDTAVIDEFRRTPWLRAIAEQGNGVLFETMAPPSRRARGQGGHAQWLGAVGHDRNAAQSPGREVRQAGL